jgi:hypothetical protein
MSFTKRKNDSHSMPSVVEYKGGSHSVPDLVLYQIINCIIKHIGWAQ